jgi:hypothetical protein
MPPTDSIMKSHHQKKKRKKTEEEKEAVMTYFKALSLYMPVETQENHKNMSEQPALELETSHIQWSHIHLIAKSG